MTQPIHLLCAFITFCSGGACQDYRALEANIRFQPGVDIAEFWVSPEGAAIPWPALMSEPPDLGFDDRLHFYISGDLSGTYLISIQPETLEATLTTHLRHGPESDAPSAASSNTTCTRVETRL